MTTKAMTLKDAEQILESLEWNKDEETLADAEERELANGNTEYAWALATYWRGHADDVGFMQPGSSLVQDVEDLIDEPVWT